jgi:hypothetical protein
MHQNFMCLQALVDDWGFAEAAFRQFAGPCFQQLATFLKSANELDSQLQASCAGNAKSPGCPQTTIRRIPFLRALLQ